MSLDIVRPGDSVIFTFPDQRMSQEQAHVVKQRCAAVLPDDVKILIIAGGTCTVVRSDPEGEPA